VPCKEEVPLLIEWEKKLKAEGIDFRLVFVSLDDDERQLTSFLSQQPSAGLRRTYWLTEGSQRTDWLSKVGMKADMELPAHLLVDASGKVRCKVQGAIESGDYSQLLGLLHGAH
jgi:thiol-disulfide isomerase/thioredoxin